MSTWTIYKDFHDAEKTYRMHFSITALWTINEVAIRHFTDRGEAEAVAERIGGTIEEATQGALF